MSTALLQLHGIRRQVGGLRILDNITLSLQETEIMGIIGPNGAGKTSLFNVISGQNHVDQGQLTFAGQSITALSVAQRARLGIARSFQSSRIFPDLSILDNLALALRVRQGSAYRWWRASHWLHSSHTLAQNLLQHTELESRASVLAGSLSYGEQRILDVLICLAQQPNLLLLDEPTAGLSPAESQSIMRLTQRHSKTCGVLLISHDVDIVMEHCQRIAVLSNGQLLACDTPANIRQHAAVQQAYLGTLTPMEQHT